MSNNYKHEDYLDAFDRQDTLALALMDTIDDLEQEAEELRTEIDEQLEEIRQQGYEIGELNARISALIREAAK